MKIQYFSLVFEGPRTGAFHYLSARPEPEPPQSNQYFFVGGSCLAKAWDTCVGSTLVFAGVCSWSKAPLGLWDSWGGLRKPWASGSWRDRPGG